MHCIAGLTRATATSAGNCRRQDYKAGIGRLETSGGAGKLLLPVTWAEKASSEDDLSHVVLSCFSFPPDGEPGRKLVWMSVRPVWGFGYPNQISHLVSRLGVGVWSKPVSVTGIIAKRPPWRVSVIAHLLLAGSPKGSISVQCTLSKQCRRINPARTDAE